MGNRYVTESEFNYIKELVKRHPQTNTGNRRMVEATVNRNYQTIKRVVAAKNFADFQESRGLVSVKTGNKKNHVEVKPEVKTAKDYTGALLAMAKRQNELLESIDRHTSSIDIRILQLYFEYKANNSESKPWWPLLVTTAGLVALFVIITNVVR